MYLPKLLEKRASEKIKETKRKSGRRYIFE
jgi:hypothetical protein